jgi:hypothetical protein
MPLPVRLFFTVAAGAFLGLAAHCLFGTLTYAGMRDGPLRDPAETLAYAIVGAACGLALEISRRRPWKRRSIAAGGLVIIGTFGILGGMSLFYPSGLDYQWRIAGLLACTAATVVWCMPPHDDTPG